MRALATVDSHVAAAWRADAKSKRQTLHNKEGTMLPTVRALSEALAQSLSSLRDPDHMWRAKGETVRGF